MWRQASLLGSLLTAFAATAMIEWPREAARPQSWSPTATTSPADGACAAAPPCAPAAPLPAAASAHQCELLLPDGSSVPALNGAEGAPPLQRFWERDRPWSPIVGTERSDAGVDWYVHADGSRSTTEMKWRSDLGRLDALTRVAHPGDAPPPPPKK
jgi:hypothetical protein